MLLFFHVFSVSVARFFLLAPPIGRRCSSHTHFTSSIFFYRFFFLKRFNINTHTGALVETYVYLELVSLFSRTVTLFPFSLSCVTWSTNWNEKKKNEKKKRKRKEREEKRKGKEKLTSSFALQHARHSRTPNSQSLLRYRVFVTCTCTVCVIACNLMSRSNAAMLRLRVKNTKLFCRLPSSFSFFFFFFFTSSTLEKRV